MKYEEFKTELRRQIGLNGKFFDKKEILTLMDFLETINKEDFDFEVKT